MATGTEIFFFYIAHKMFERRINRLFWAIVFSLAGLGLVACSDDSSSPSYVEETSSGSYSDPLSEKGSSGEVQKDSLGRPISSAGGSSSQGAFDNSSSSTGPVVGIEDTVVTDTTTVVDVDALPECTAASEGETFMVQSENTLYFCLAGQWVASDAVAETSGITCRDGILVTGADSEEEDDDSGSSGGNTFPWGNFGGGSTVNTAAVDTAEPRMLGAHLVGVAEKGPFRYGTSVKLIELDSSQHLADSKRTHKTCILNADGNFSFDSVDFVSPYLRVKASGYFRNELTGGLSSSLVTLEAVVDVTEKDSVNVNMLTHMEAPRVLKLVENSGGNQPIRAVKTFWLRSKSSGTSLLLREAETEAWVAGALANSNRP